MRKKRSRNLDDSRIKQIVEILDGWSGKLTWNLLIDAIEIRFYCRYTRQALFKSERIKSAFELRKENLADENPLGAIKSVELQKAVEIIARLKAENDRLESENHKLLDQFVRWAYNSHLRGLSVDFLNQPLPAVNRK